MATTKRSSARGDKLPAAAPTPKTKPAKPAGVGATLTVKLARFVTEYMVDFNGRQAAIRAGYSAKTADQAASRMLRMPAVRAALNTKKAEAKAAERTQAVANMELTVERTKLEIARLAYFDPRKLYSASGEPIPLHELDDDTAAAIAGLDVLEEFEGSGEERHLIGHVRKWKLADKNAALEKASKILGLYKEDNDQKGKSTAEALKEFISGLRQGGGAIPIAKRAN